MRKPNRTPSELSDDLKPEVEVLRSVVTRALKRCMIEYFQLLSMSFIDKKYSIDYLSSTLHDSVELSNVIKELDSKGFRNRRIWQEWHYIRPLVTKYISETESDDVMRLDEGARGSLGFWICRLVGGTRAAASEKERPEIYITEDTWSTLPHEALNELLNEVSEIWGLEKRMDRNWRYEDVFCDNSRCVLYETHGHFASEPDLMVF